jgi:putative transposase
MLDVSHSGYYAWLVRPPSRRSIENQQLLKLIQDSYEASGKIYGSPRIWFDLLELGERVGRNRVARIMRINKIRAQRGYKRPDYRYHKPALAAPNRLQQQFTIDHPDTAWVTDITYSAPSLRKLTRMMLSGLEHVWNASRIVLEETNWMPALCYERA